MNSERISRPAALRFAAGEYAVGSAHTNNIEGFFGHLKPSIRGTYRKVSHKWLQGDLNEFCFRYNERGAEQSMFRTLLLRAADPS